MARKTIATQEEVEAKRLRFAQVAATVDEVPVEKFLEDNFLPYAWSQTLDRALVDSSGLKPVQRRILYTMYKETGENRTKVATLAGKVLQYHPHGDASVVDALKNLGRDHVYRVPLIDGRGDFGSPGSPGAAGRYIEGKLSKAAAICVEEIGESAVRMVSNYDATTVEPVRIPVRWPVGVINGGAGIAVGYAAKMPSHNPTEIMELCKKLLSKPDMSDDDIFAIVSGPDFNMGGIVTSNDGVKEYLTTGSGTFKIRGNYEVIPGARGVTRIEFDQIPFGTDPESIISEIQKGASNGKFAEIASYKNLSDLKHPIRVVVETKPGVQYKKVLRDLFAGTSLEVSFSANMTTIIDSRPVKSSMRDLILDFIAFRKQCVENKMRFNLGKKNDRLHVVEGLLLVLLDIDKAISIIRNSDDSNEASKKLMTAFKIDEKQASYVLSLQLRRLTKMDKTALDTEKANLTNEIDSITTILSEPAAMRSFLLKEFSETQKIIGDERKTVVNDMSAADFTSSEKAEAKVLKDADKNLPRYITRFADGTLLNSAEPFGYDASVKKLAHGPIVEAVKVNSQDAIVLIGSDGTGHKVPVIYVPQDRAVTAADAGVSLGAGVRLVGVSKFEAMKSDIGLAIGTKDGSVKIAKTDFPKSDSFPVINLDAGDEITDTRWIGRTLTNTFFVMVSSSGKVLMFDASGIRPTGSKAGGVKGMKLRGDDDAVIHFAWVNDVKTPTSSLVTVTNATVKRTPLSDIPPKGKGSMGVDTQIFRKDETGVVAAFAGTNPVSVPAKGAKTVVGMPPLVKRSSRGVDVPTALFLGSSDVTVM